MALKFRLNKKEPEEQENDYIEFKEITSLDNILIFTSSIKDFLRKMCTTKKTNFSITEETNLLNTLQYNNQILAQTQSYAGNFYSLEDCYFDLDRENDFSIEEWRGISNSDENIRYILVEAPVELVAQTYYRLKSMNVWLPNTYGNKIVIQPNSILVFRFRGHKWSVIYEPSNVYSGEIIPTEEDALKISELLNTAAIFYVNSDTSGYIAYDFYDKGVLLERLDYQEYSEIKFESQLRVLDPKDIYGYDLTYNFLSDRGAYIPCLYEENFFIPEKERILQMNKLLPNEMERMDYLAKKFDKSNEIFSPTVMSQGTI